MDVECNKNFCVCSDLMWSYIINSKLLKLTMYQILLIDQELKGIFKFYCLVFTLCLCIKASLPPYSVSEFLSFNDEITTNDFSVGILLNIWGSGCNHAKWSNFSTSSNCRCNCCNYSSTSNSNTSFISSRSKAVTSICCSSHTAAHSSRSS